MSGDNTNTQDTVTEDLPQEVIIIVGCVCGIIVVALTVVLIVLCCKRQKSKQNYEKQQENTQMSPVLETSSPSPDNSDISKVKPGLDNPGLDQVNHSPVDMDRSQEGPFVTNASGHNPNLPYENHRYNAAEAPSQHWNGHINFENQPHSNHQHIHHDHAPRQDRYGPPPTYPEAQQMQLMDDPEPQKPKKVIYEVVV